jgi:hypothetical protein
VLEGESLAEVHYRTLVANQGEDSELVPFSLDSYHAFKARISLAAEAARDPQLSIAAAPFFAAFAYVATNRKYCLTGNGSVGVVPADAQHGDQVCIFLGIGTPFVIRSVPSPEACYYLVGECYIDGLMNEQALLRNSKDLRDISLA